MGLALIRNSYDEVRMRFWSEFPCTILATDLVKEVGDDSVTWRTTARYEYEVGKQKLTGHRVTITQGPEHGNDFHRQLHAELSECLQQGKPYHCFVNPNDPTDCILNRDSGWISTVLLTIGALLFGAVGYGLLAVALFFKDDPDKKSNLQTASSARRKIEWKSGEIKYSDRGSARILSWIGLAIVVVSVPSLIASAFAVSRGENLAFLGMIPVLLGIWILIRARRRSARYRRYGESLFKMTNGGGVIGGRLNGLIVTERRVESADGFLVRLWCTETTRSSDSESSSSRRTVWEDEITVIRDIPLQDSEGTAIPIELAVPPDVPQSCDKDDSDQIQWKLSARSISAAADYFAEFEVPVFRTSDSNQKRAPAASSFEQFQAPADPDRGLKRAGLSAESLGQEGTRFIFPRTRNIGFSIAMAIVQTVFAIGIAAAFYFWWFSIWMYAAAVLGVLILQAFADLFFFRSEVDVSSNGIAVRSGVYLVGPPRNVDAADIKRVFSNWAGSAGNISAFDLYAEMNDGKKVLLAKRIIPEQIVKEIIQRIESLLRGKPSSASDVVN